MLLVTLHRKAWLNICEHIKKNIYNRKCNCRIKKGSGGSGRMGKNFAIDCKRLVNSLPKRIEEVIKHKIW